MIQSTVDKVEQEIKSLPSRVSRLCERNDFAVTARLVRKVDVDAPLTLTFIFVCCFIEALKSLVGSDVIYSYFAVPSWSNFSVYTARCWCSLATQVIGHSSWGHLFGNTTLLLLIGPTNERAFGMYVMLKVMFITAVASSLAHIWFGAPSTLQLGASGLVFMQILLSSLIEVKHGRIPLTFLVQGSLWCYKEVALCVTQALASAGGSDGVSHIAHVSGALCGVLAGYLHVDSSDFKKRGEEVFLSATGEHLPNPYNNNKNNRNSHVTMHQKNS